MSTKKYYITTPIYYVNDKPHIGHAYTTVAADILSRFHQMQGEDVFFLTGTDEHGAKIAEAARLAGKEPQEFCDEIAVEFQKAWGNLNIEYSHFIRTTDQDHEAGVAAFLSQLKEKDFLYEKDYVGLYCIGCEKFLTEKELVDGKCPDHKRVPEKVTEKNWFFKLSRFLPKIEQLIENNALAIAPENAQKEVIGLFRQGLDDFSISRQKVSWGIRVPWDQSQTFYVWVDALLNYWTALKITGKENYWPPDVQLVGKDILKFHAIFWPAMLLAADLPLPKKIFVHGYFTINGQKMSKSLGNVIDPNDLVKKFGVDATRYLLFSQFPFGNDGDISLEKLKAVYNADLANGVGNLVSRILKMTKNGQVPEKDIKGTEESEKPIDRIWSDALEEGKKPYTFPYFVSQLWLGWKKELNDLKLGFALERIVTFASILDKRIEDEKPFKLFKEDSKKAGYIIYDLLESLRHIAWMLMPFMPETADKIFEQLGLDLKKEKAKNFEEAIKWGGLEPGTKIKVGKPLFPRIE